MSYLLLVSNVSEISSYCNKKTFKTCRNLVDILKCQKRKWWRSLFGVKDSILPAEGRLLSGDKSKWVSQLKMNNNICTMYIGHSCQRSLLFPVCFWPDFYNFDQNFDHIWHYWQYVSQFAFNFITLSRFQWDESRNMTEGKTDRTRETRETWMSFKPDWHITYISKLQRLLMFCGCQKSKWFHIAAAVFSVRG